MKDKISIKEVNDLVWGGKWEGPIDPTALRERIQDLISCENKLSALQKQLITFKAFILSGW